jgi:hypothetical protein
MIVTSQSIADQKGGKMHAFDKVREHITRK